MTTTYHLNSAQEITIDILEAIKMAFKNKPITIIVEERDDSDELTAEQKQILDYRLNEDKSTYLTAEDSINELAKKYGL